MLTGLAILIGIALVAVVGMAHHSALKALARLKARDGVGRDNEIRITFLGLLILHLVEIMAFAAANMALLHWEAFAGSTEKPLNWADVIYLTAVNFTTLGYTQIELAGELRFVTVQQALGGFMLLTWSATYLYSVCRKTWHEPDPG